LKELDINNKCPKCNSSNIKKQGVRSTGVQRLRCKECGTSFTYFSGTILERSKYHYEFFIELIYQMLSFKSTEAIKAILENDLFGPGIDQETEFNWKHKIMEAARYVPSPQLDDVVEIDECFIREGQKGSLQLVDPMNSALTRKARKTFTPSKAGVMGPEHSTLVCAIDHSNHVVAKCVGVGVVKDDIFEKEFFPYINKATWLCTDANTLYSRYCKKYVVNHYVRPSNYLDNLHKGIEEGSTEAQLYQAEMLDYIEAGGMVNMPFEKFKKLKEKHGLGLGHVNSFHSDLKLNLVKKTKGISLVHVPAYVAWLCLLHNYAVDHGHKPTTKKDAEEILVMLLKTKASVKDADFQKRRPDFSNVSTSYKNNLIKQTEKLQEKANDFNRYLTPEDISSSFNKRQYLESIPLYMVKFLAKRCRIPGRTSLSKKRKYKILRALEVHPEINEAIAEMRAIFETYQAQ